MTSTPATTPSPSRGIFPPLPIPNLRRLSGSNQPSASSPHPGEPKPIPSSPPIANRRGSMATSPTTPNRLSQSWFLDAGLDLGSGKHGGTGAEDGGVEWDLEKGVKLDDLRAMRAARKDGARRKSGIDGLGADSSRPTTLQEEEGGGGQHQPQDGDEEEEEEAEDDWDHTHPCFPHPNPHVPLSSPEWHTTRIIRIPRDYMINGDNTPAFSIVYPVILEPYVSEDQFRKIIDGVNENLRLAFDPWNKWNWIDVIMGLVTFWIWEEFWPTYVKRGLREVEKVLEVWNETLGKQGAKVVGLRRSAYITLDIQIPDPLREDSEDGQSMDGKGAEHGELKEQHGDSTTPLPAPPPAALVAGDEARKRTLSNAESIPTVKINGDLAR